MGKRSGFTLIELLVVIAIIALLMAILMPSLNRAKKQAREITCQVNLKQWALIWQIYTDDNDGFFPYCGSLGWKRGTWVIALRPQYETRTNILRCPMAMKRLPSGDQWGGPYNTYIMGTGGVGDRQEECSYGANCWIYNPEPGQTVIQGRPVEWNWRTPNVKGGNYVPVFADTMWRGGGPYEKGERGDPPDVHGHWYGFKAEMKHFCINRHSFGTVNHLFMDGSVRKVGLKELWLLKWHREFKTGGPDAPWTISGGVTIDDWPPWMRKFKDY